MEDCGTEGEAMLPPTDLVAEDDRTEEKKSWFFSNHKIEEEEKIGEEQNDAKDEDKGVISSLISTMVSPLSFRTGEAETEDDENRGGDLKKTEEDDENGGREDRGGGIIKNVISNLFHRSEGEAMVESEDEEEEKKMEGDEGVNGGDEGIIGNLVSYLPASIPGNKILIVFSFFIFSSFRI